MHPSASVEAVCRSGSHTFSKTSVTEIELLAGLGVADDAHAGVTVRHRSRVAQDPRQPNLRQVHLIHAELLGDLRAREFRVGPGDLGENVTTRGLDLLGLPRGALLYLGDTAVVEVTGLRNPCAQIEGFQPGLLAAVLGRDEQGNLIRRAGVMGVVRLGGVVRPGDPIRVDLPEEPHQRLERV
ncbi:MOSC domain-containing protein [Deinococcus aerius]|uniref:MOSC domain-containing protein n=1 Tax=Deinococcus aerius TaxID=200253 RepID=A0A2I9CU62_9DEIO|nr:MOSC domain-containing protein [Deinococcus aerius]GBF05362.1 MOSC domain-containing protein [Deinococcus aerius]